MRKIIIFIVVLYSGISCNTQDISIIGNWATVINSKYYEYNINERHFTVYDDTGTYLYWHGYIYENNILSIPRNSYDIIGKKYDVTYYPDICHIMLSGEDTMILERINFDETKISFYGFNYRKYNLLVSKGIVSADSAINFFWNLKNINDTTHYDNMDKYLNK